MSLSQAIQLNNEGVAALMEGCENGAITCLSKSIRLLKQELALRYNNTNDDSSSKKNTKFNASSSTSSLAFSDDFESTNTISSSSNSSTVELPERDDQQQSFIFNEALTLPECPSTDDDDITEQDIHTYTGAVIFNLALSYHRKGNHDSLVKADKLYTMALKLLVDDFTSRISILVKLASINNLSQIRFESGNFISAAQGLDHLSQFMLRGSSNNTASSSSPSLTSRPMFQEPQIKGLLMNVLLLKVPKVAPAA